MTCEADALWMHSREGWLLVRWPEGEVLAANRQASQLCGQSTEQMVGKPWWELLESESTRRLTDWISQWRRGAAPSERAGLWLHRADEAKTPITLRAVRIENAANGGTQHFLVFDDRREPQALAGMTTRLVRLDRDNLFITQVSAHDLETWYRLHPLLREVLQARAASQGEDAVKSLHAVAWRWFSARGYIDEAVRHAVQAGELAAATDLVEACAEDLLARGALSRLAGLMRRLPVEHVQGSFRLLLMTAYLQMHARDLDGLQGSLRRDNDVGGITGNRDTGSLMLVARWNLYRGGADRAQSLSAAERKTEADNRLDDTFRAIAENVAIAMESRATSESRLTHLQQYVDASQGTLKAYRAQFEISRRTLLDLLNAEDELFNARSNLAAGAYDDLTNVYFVDASKGILAGKFGVSGAEP